MQLKHLRDQREGLTEQLATAARSREDRERQLSEAQAEQLASVTAELSRAQALLRDREQAAGASERLQVWVCGCEDAGEVGHCCLGEEGFSDEEWGRGTAEAKDTHTSCELFQPLPLTVLLLPPIPRAAQAHIGDELAASRAQGLRLQ